MSQTTKQVLAASLMKLLETKPLDRITVTDLTQDCGVNRQTFYYHFQDIYALVDWIFLQQGEEVLAGDKTYATWRAGFFRVFQYLQSNQRLVLHTYHSISRDQLEAYLYRVTFHLLSQVLEELSEGLSIRQEDRDFIAHFYKYAFVGLVLDWVREGMKADPQLLVDKVGELLQGDFRRGLEKLSVMP